MTGASASPSMWRRALGWEIGVTNGRYRSRIIKTGAGMPIVLMHGQGGHVENFMRNIDALATGHRVLAFDFLWHGMSAPTPFDERLIPAFCDQFLDLLDSEGISSCTVVGQSLGGWVAAALAARVAHRIDALILVTPMGIGPAAAAILSESARASLLHSTLEALDDPTLPNIRKRLERVVSNASEIDDEMVSVRAAIYQRPETNASLREVALAYLGPKSSVATFALGPEELARITCPTLVYWGRHNNQPPAVGEAIRSMVGDARAEFHCADAGHWAHYEHSDQFNAIVLNFLHRRTNVAESLPKAATL